MGSPVFYFVNLSFPTCKMYIKSLPLKGRPKNLNKMAYIKACSQMLQKKKKKIRSLLNKLLITRKEGSRRGAGQNGQTGVKRYKLLVME